jgi:hypothetical protein
MTAPDERKSMRVSPEVHALVSHLATKLDCSADEALRHLFHEATVRLDLTDVQRERWQAYADASGVSLAEWIVLRVEAAIQYGCDPGSMHIALDHLRALTAHHGITVKRTQPPRPR